MKQKWSGLTASMVQDHYCGTCGWPIISACCNDEIFDLHPDEDWWWYCSNKGCVNHKGEAFVQGAPSFAVRYGEHAPETST